MEALTRFRTKPYRPPNEWFAAAADIGLASELELATLDSALPILPRLAPGECVSVNVSPATVVGDEWVSRIERAPLGQVTVELTEHEGVGSYARLNERLRPLRARGLRIAVDDAGAGFASLNHILELAPDFIKLDMGLTREIHQNAPKRALAAAMKGFASEIGSILIAEGVETEAELATLRSLGIDVVQGFLLARPAPADEALGHCRTLAAAA